jgi:hypothetical protein
MSQRIGAGAGAGAASFPLQEWKSQWQKDETPQQHWAEDEYIAYLELHAGLEHGGDALPNHLEQTAFTSTYDSIQKFKKNCPNLRYLIKVGG